MAVAVARTVARAAMAGIAAGVVTVAGQIMHVGHLDLPEHPDLDATGTVGSPGLPMLDVVVVGDSSCTGPGLDRAADIWVRQLLASFDRHTFAVQSFAAGGAQTSDVIAGQLPAAMSRRRDIAIVSVAANDALHGRNPIGVEARLSRIVDELLDHAGAVILMGVGDVGSAPRLPFPLSAMATAVCRTVDLVHRRVAGTRPGVFKAPMCEVTTAAFRSRSDVWATDRYHPNAAGHTLWADAVRPAFADALAHIQKVPPIPTDQAHPPA
jgi:lysophospholipase L1-like esterase